MALDEEFDLDEAEYEDEALEDAAPEPEQNHRILSLDDIKKANDVTEEQIHIPEWDGDILIKSITYNELKKIRRASMRNGERDEDLMMQGVVMAGVVQPELLSADYRMLQERSASAMVRLFTAIMEKSKLGETESVKKEQERFPRR
jgi:hypothetical protein